MQLVSGGDERQIRMAFDSSNYWSSSLEDPVMKKLIVPAAAVLLAGLAQTVLAERPGQEPTALQKKMLGVWKGQTACDGNLQFRADGTYELKDYGPAPYNCAGTWKLRWDALPPTLVLTCKSSDIPGELGKITEVKVIKLDDQHLAIEYGNQNGSPPGHYTRVKVDSPEARLFTDPSRCPAHH
jgi:hypothetical protein